MPSRIGVLTFHRCINYGSYWQARCLVEGLRSRDVSAVLLDHRSHRVDRAEWRCALRPTLPSPAPAADRGAYGDKARRFFEAFGQLPLSRPFEIGSPGEMEPLDAVVVGSDEVWNLRHPWYAGYPLFFGEGLRAERVVSYAASFGNFDAVEPLEPSWSQRLATFSAVGVRDDNSRRIVKAALGRDPALVLDPCLQFAAIARRPAARRNDELIVYGHNFPDWFASQVVDAARRNRLRLVSLGYRNDWADEQRLSEGPEDFARAMGSARAVATNFFHGCVFALLNATPFACATSVYRANKVTALLDQLGLDRRRLRQGDGPDAYDRLLGEPPGPETFDRLEVLRRRSADYLRHALH